LTPFDACSSRIGATEPSRSRRRIPVNQAESVASHRQSYSPGVSFSRPVTPEVAGASPVAPLLKESTQCDDLLHESVNSAEDGTLIEIERADRTLPPKRKAAIRRCSALASRARAAPTTSRQPPLAARIQPDCGHECSHVAATVFHTGD
jgi:hypothetical protein